MPAAPFWGARRSAPDEWSLALWAPSASAIRLELEGLDLPMVRGADGVHRCIARASEGGLYRFRAGDFRFADPASLQQEGGVEGHSVLRDLAPMTRRAQRAAPGPFARQVITEIHVGSFTREGSFAAAARTPELRRMAALGITAIELMPLGQFPGTRGWGYDSVLPYAPQDSYGPPEDLAALVDAAHRLGLLVYLDVVLNHFGPQGNALARICPEFFLAEENDWGPRIDYSRPAARAFFVDCARHWLRHYHFDGLRIDAIQEMKDDSALPIETELALALRREFPEVHLLAEDSRNRTAPYDPANRLYDAAWNDDYHHALHVHLTGESFGYYREFTLQPLRDLSVALRDGQALQGQTRPDGSTAKGEPSAHLPPSRFINFNLNHDHAGNRPRGERLVSLVGVERAQVAHALLLTAPYVPLLFMGEECGAQSAFPWFADYAGQVAADMAEERRKQFRGLPGGGLDMLDPFDPATATLAHPYARPAPDQESWLDLTRRMLELRRQVLLPIYRTGRAHPATVVITGPGALVADWHFRTGTVRAALSFQPTSASAPDRTAPEGRTALPLAALGEAGTPWFRLWLSRPTAPAPAPRPSAQ
ncbi:alpha-amylase family glycosyl hydrolase [Tabrizicola soli]|uniref:Malto-oligosyltrehalose trehalohydrolase n=1 Tax=Tabrizicola soli TaxID=2185115 RepID=A0ABV7DU80_9RHOB|nr:alpha-amylase family glycosyl hydrolase [Tabrizicola soli]